MGYYNYHAMIKKRIASGEPFSVQITDKYKNISPCMLIEFSDRVYPVRAHKFDDYLALFDSLGIKIRRF